MDQLKTSPSLADEESVCAIQSGGPAGDAAIMSLYSRHHHEIRASLLKLMSRHIRYKPEADDIVHDSFVLMLHKIRNESMELISVRAYWLGVARNLWLNHRKRNERMLLVEDADEVYGAHEYTPEYIMLTEERYTRLDQCFTNCGGRCREILLMWLSDYTMQEIADAMKLSSPAMARKIKHECFKKLKDMVVKSNIFTT